MKKILLLGMIAIASVVTATTSAYQVYDVKFTGKTTKSAGTKTTECGDTYAYRDVRTVKIQGVLAGCGCAASIADGTCEAAVTAFWNATDKTPITDTELVHEILQRIAKKADKVEEFASVSFANTNTGWEAKIWFGGFGKYKANKTDTEYDYVSSITGQFAGWMTAPKTKTSCGVCGDTTGGDTTQAIALCDCACTVSDTADKTPYAGTYSIKYNGTKAKKCAKNGITAKSLGIPSYVQFSIATDDE